MDVAQAIAQAREAARQAAEVLYEHSCDVVEYRDKKIGGETKQRPVVVHKNIPCRFCYAAATTQQTDSMNNIDYDGLLILTPNLKIKAGSELVITHDGGAGIFKQSGEAAVFSTHQEIMLKRIDRA